ncbi:MAG: hypothetical protein U5K79_01400 [Cyclobacteriaceae bacterium]|nr:hypothetical protein [Cyclobacteriaceae bacterium]
MKTINIFTFITAMAAILIFSSCDNNGGDDIPKKTGVVVVNQGNFGQGNGTLSFYDEEQKTITNNILANANNGAALGSIIESIQQHDGMGHLVCNAADKIEFFDINNFKFLANPVTNINTPRYMVVSSDKAYITCYGTYDANFMLPDSYVAVMNITNKTIIDSLECGSGPEGIALFNNKIYVANSYESSVSVIEISSGNSSKIQLEAAPQHFALDENLQLWVTVTSYYGTYPADKVGLQAINTSTNTKGQFIEVPGLSDDGLVAVNGSGDTFYLLTAEPWPGTATNVLEFHAESKSLAADPLVTGENFYGIGYNTSTDRLYVADAAGFAGNGKILVYDAEGTLIDEQVASVGPFQFMFK